MTILFEELEKIDCKFGEVFTSYHLEQERIQIIDAVEWNYKSNMGEVYYNSKYSNPHDKYISMKSNKLISKEEHEKEWKENVE